MQFFYKKFEKSNKKWRTELFSVRRIINYSFSLASGA
jgi:hypothetical protein